MDGERALLPAGFAAGATAVAIAREHLLAEASDVGAVLPLEGVAGRAQAPREDRRPSTGAVHAPLQHSLHEPPLTVGIFAAGMLIVPAALPCSAPFCSAVRRSSAAWAGRRIQTGANGAG